MTETHGLSSESTQQESLSNEYQYDSVQMVFKKSFHPRALDESSLSIGRVYQDQIIDKQDKSGINLPKMASRIQCYFLCAISRIKCQNPNKLH